jgi:hypothetical protein
MKRTIRLGRQPVQGGAVAVEAAIVLSFLVFFLTLPSLQLAFYCYKYSAAQKAVHDAALYLSTAPKLEMWRPGPDGNPAALTLAKNILTNELAGLSPDEPSIVCFYQQTGGAIVAKQCTPANNQSTSQTLVQLTISISISYVDPLTRSDTGMIISPYATVRYLGN